MSSVLAIVLSFIFYPVISGFLGKIGALEWIQAPIQSVLTERIFLLGEISPENLLAQFHLPESVSESLLSTIGEASGPELIISVSAAVAGFVLDIICIIIIFIIVKIGLLLLKGLLEKIAKIPVLKQIDKLGGVLFGLLEAFLFLTIVGAIFSLFSGTVDSGLLSVVEQSVVGKFFYEQNLLILFLSSKI